MDLQEYFEQKKNVQQNFLNYLDDGTEQDYSELIKLITNLKIDKDRNEFKTVLQLIYALVKNHHRSPDFFAKINKVLSNYQSNIKQYFTSKELIDMFYSQKIVILFMLEDNIITIDDIPRNIDFLSYFYTEFENQLNDNEKEKVFRIFEQYNLEYNAKTFAEKRKLGENDKYLCTLIRKDLVVDFISHVSYSNLSLSSSIEPSFFETNSFLIRNKDCTLIEYASFFGSIQIFQYLKMNNVKLTHSLWFYSIHSKSSQMINILEEIDNKLDYNDDIPESKTDTFYYLNKPQIYLHKKSSKKKPKLDLYYKLLRESIKCHHIELANYINDNFICNENGEEIDYDDYFKIIIKKSEINDCLNKLNVADSIFRYYNYLCFPKVIDDENLFFFSCRYDYLSLVMFLIQSKEFLIHNEIIFNIFLK